MYVHATASPPLSRHSPQRPHPLECLLATVRFDARTNCHSNGRVTFSHRHALRIRNMCNCRSQHVNNTKHNAILQLLVVLGRLAARQTEFTLRKGSHLNRTHTHTATVFVGQCVGKYKIIPPHNNRTRALHAVSLA